MPTDQLLKTALTTSVSIDMESEILADPSTGNYMPVRLYLPVAAHGLTFAENPQAITSTLNKPRGIIPHHTEGHSNTTPGSISTTSTANTGDNDFRNSMYSQGVWELAMSSRGTLQRLTVYHPTANPNGLLPQDATDARGYKILGNKNYLLSGSLLAAESGTEYPSGIFGMTADQLRNELIFLAGRQQEFGTQGGVARNPLYYMYPHWRRRPLVNDLGGGNYSYASLADQPHFFRGFVRSISIDDESGTPEAYGFTLTFNIVNQRPS